MYYVYIIQSEKDGSFYIGHTRDLEERVKRHNQGRSKYTKSKLPWTLVYYEKVQTKAKAVQREKLIKSYKGGREFKKLFDNIIN